jgi:glycosyltransferase involved in cell wall biosynthesis
MLFLAIAILAVTLVTTLQLLLGLRSIVQLSEWQVEADALDKISVIVPARNEQQHIETALQSLLNIDYPNIEFMVVNDRSEDATGQILERMAAADPRLRVLNITELPAGWLGKNYALHQGAEVASGEWLLFADADVSFDPTVLRRAMSYTQYFQLDHLAATPGIVAPGPYLKIFVLSFITLFCAYFKPWRARNPGSSRHVGIGAFNFVRRSAYIQAGGHQKIRMRPDDDLMLGRIVKRAGFRQDVVHGIDLITVPWYDSVGQAIVGMEKNAFSGVNYRVSIVIAGAVALLLTNIWPFFAVLLTRGIEQLIYACVVLMLIGFSIRVASWMNFPRWTALGYPLGVLLIIYIQWRAMYLTLRYRGIRWRDTHYSLAELKANQIV